MDGEWSASRPGRFIPLGESPLYLVGRGLGGPQSRSELCVEEKNLLFLARIRPRFFGYPAHTLIGIPTEQ
jgi:hypothetical protein